jgi:hypothetical protein
MALFLTGESNQPENRTAQPDEVINYEQKSQQNNP